ncbi:MAG: hypothetical protein ACKV1O_13960 [Saprospiraceae bacterium]
MSHPLHLRLKALLLQNTGEVLQHLQKVFSNNPPSYNEVILLHYRLQDLQQKQRKGTLRAEEENVLLRELTDSILSLIDTITPEEAATYDLENAIFKRILVVCKSAEREEYLRALFPEEYFKGVEFDVSERPRPAASVNKFDLVVFDNFPSDDPNDTNDLLRYYLNDTKPYLLYFSSQYLPWLGKDYPEKAYFANSVFSIHARIEEMVLYLKYRPRGRQL